LFPELSKKLSRQNLDALGAGIYYKIGYLTIKRITLRIQLFQSRTRIRRRE